MRYEHNGWTASYWQTVDPRFPSDEGIAREEEARQWCLDYEGKGKFFVSVFGLFYFEEDEDREMFLLRWGGET